MPVSPAGIEPDGLAPSQALGHLPFNVNHGNAVRGIQSLTLGMSVRPSRKRDGVHSQCRLTGGCPAKVLASTVPVKYPGAKLIAGSRCAGA